MKTPGRHSVLLVDDAADQLQLAALYLARSGFAVTPAVNGAEALKRLSEHPFDVILSDIQMPEMDGLELYARVKAMRVRPPLFLMTASPELARTATLVGAQVFRKPLDFAEVVSVLIAACLPESPTGNALFISP